MKVCEACGLEWKDFRQHKRHCKGRKQLTTTELFEENKKLRSQLAASIEEILIDRYECPFVHGSYKPPNEDCDFCMERNHISEKMADCWLWYLETRAKESPTEPTATKREDAMTKEEIIDAPLTKEERNAISSLKRLATRWPKSLWLFSASGTLCVVRRGPDGEQATSYEDGREGGVDPDYVVDTVGIDNDGGDW